MMFKVGIKIHKKKNMINKGIWYTGLLKTKGKKLKEENDKTTKKNNKSSHVLEKSKHHQGVRPFTTPWRIVRKLILPMNTSNQHLTNSLPLSSPKLLIKLFEIYFLF